MSAGGEILVAIDPGKTGGIAWMARDLKNSANAITMPKTREDLSDALAEITLVDYSDAAPLTDEHRDVLVWLEEVGSMPTDGRKGIATFLNHYGHLQMGLTDCGIEEIPIRPNKWIVILRKEYIPELPKGVKGYSERKRMIKDFVRSVFPNPNLKVTLATSDALAMLWLANGRLI